MSPLSQKTTSSNITKRKPSETKKGCSSRSSHARARRGRHQHQKPFQPLQQVGEKMDTSVAIGHCSPSSLSTSSSFSSFLLPSPSHQTAAASSQLSVSTTMQRLLRMSIIDSSDGPSGGGSNPQSLLYEKHGHLVTMKELRRLAQVFHIKKYGSIRKRLLFELIQSRVTAKFRSAVKTIESWWSAYAFRKKSICPITLEPIPMKKSGAAATDGAFCLVEPPQSDSSGGGSRGRVFLFSTDDLASYMMDSLQFVNPCTRRELLSVEVLRLAHRAGSRGVALGLFELYQQRERKRAEKQLLENDFLAIENILEEIVEFVLEEGMNITREGNNETDVNNMAWFVGINTLRTISACVAALRHQYSLQRSAQYLSLHEFREYLQSLQRKILHMIQGSPVLPNRYFIHGKIMTPLYEGTKCIFDGAISAASSSGGQASAPFGAIVAASSSGGQASAPSGGLASAPSGEDFPQGDLGLLGTTNSNSNLSSFHVPIHSSSSPDTTAAVSSTLVTTGGVPSNILQAYSALSTTIIRRERPLPTPSSSESHVSPVRGN